MKGVWVTNVLYVQRLYRKPGDAFPKLGKIILLPGACMSVGR